MKLKALLQLTWAGQKNMVYKNWFLSMYNKTKPLKSNNYATLSKSLFNFPSPCTGKNPTQPTTKRKTKTDFGKDVNTGDGLHGYISLTEYLWA